jgi:iron complex outermembrane receptor protein
MQSNDRPFISVRAAVRLALLGTGMLLPAYSATAAEQQTQEIEEVVVTGFRGSLNRALDAKRNDTKAIDVIAAEDVGKFPDSNLAESMQRVPGVTLSRGDGGEGRNISVRGLGPTFTRVRINGMEAAAQMGSSDIYGAGNSGRSFDFNVFPTEIFSQLAVIKTPTADVEEGSLGATVDLRAPRPFDYEDNTIFTMTGRGVYNNISEDVDPRASMLVSKKFFDDTFGVLASVAYQSRHIREVGYSAVDVLAADSSNAVNLGTAANPIIAPYCTPIGWTTTAQSPVNSTAKGSDALNCSTGNPRSGTIAAYQTVYDLRRADALNRAGSGAFLPRLPRYVNSEQDTERTGGTVTLQWQPGENTTLSIDGLMSRYQVERRDNYILGLSLGRSIAQNGQPMVSVKDIAFDEHGSVQYALFDGMDVRSEGLVDQFVSTFRQISLDLDHRFNDEFKISFRAGRSLSKWEGPMRLQTFLDAIDVDNFSIDFRGGRETPLINFGNIDVSDPNSFRYGPPLADATVLGGFSTQGKPSENITDINTFELSGDWQLNEKFGMKVGAQYRENEFNAHVANLVPAFTAVQNLPAGRTLADITKQISGLDDKFGSGAPASWVAVDSKKWREVFNFDAMPYCSVECGANKSGITEKVKTAYLVLNFNSGDDWAVPIRGDLGVRYVKTDQFALGYIPVPAPMGAPFASVGQLNEVNKSYNDTLPSFNIVAEFTPDLLMRLSASKVIARADLTTLTPSKSITATTRTGVFNNPNLDPIRAKTADLGLEWYFAPGSLLSVAYFYKDIETYIQRITSPYVFNTLGLPDDLLGNPRLAQPTETFNISEYANTPGGPLKGFEINAQVPFKFLNGFWGNFGVLANYTKVDSQIEYALTSSGGQILTSTTNDLVNLSRNSASGTLFYDDGTFSIRFTGSYRDKYIRGIPASPGSDLQGNKANLFVDGAASWNLSDNFTLIFEAQNITDERNTLFIDSVREDTLFQTEIGRTFNLGATFKF